MVQNNFENCNFAVDGGKHGYCGEQRQIALEALSSCIFYIEFWQDEDY